MHEREMMHCSEKICKSRGLGHRLYPDLRCGKTPPPQTRAVPGPDKRVFINTDVCEGCGDCGVQSNCVSIVPVRPNWAANGRLISQSATRIFLRQRVLPVFRDVRRGASRKGATANWICRSADPELPAINGTHNVVITGVGGTGVVTIGAVLAQAAQIDGKGAGMMEMAGWRKRAARCISIAVWPKTRAISCDPCGHGRMRRIDRRRSGGVGRGQDAGPDESGRTGAVVNSHEIITGDFTRDTEFTLPTDRLQLALQARLRTACDCLMPRIWRGAAGRFDLFQHDGVWGGLAARLIPVA